MIRVDGNNLADPEVNELLNHMRPNTAGSDNADAQAGECCLAITCERTDLTIEPIIRRSINANLGRISHKLDAHIACWPIDFRHSTTFTDRRNDDRSDGDGGARMDLRDERVLTGVIGPRERRLAAARMTVEDHQRFATLASALGGARPERRTYFQVVAELHHVFIAGHRGPVAQKKPRSRIVRSDSGEANGCPLHFRCGEKVISERSPKLRRDIKPCSHRGSFSRCSQKRKYLSSELLPASQAATCQENHRYCPPNTA